MATVAEIQQEIARLQAEASAYQSRIATLRQDLDRATPGAQPRLTQALGIQEQGLQDLQNQILSLQRDLAAAQAAQPAPAPALSAGQAVQADQQGGPLQQPPTETGVDRNGNNVGIAIRDETGQLSTLRRNPETGELYEAAGLPSPDNPAATNTTASDDAGDQGESTDPEVQQQLQQDGTKSLEQKAGIYIFPRPNILDNFASYTWAASLYIMSQEQYTLYCRAPARNINSYLLLMQSGGAPVNQGGRQPLSGAPDNLYQKPGKTTAGRNPEFGDDFYIDDIEIKSILTVHNGHGSNAIQFKVTETENITLLDRLHAVVQNMETKQGVKNVNFTTAHFLMVIRFYGYDENGQPVQIKGGNTPSDPLAVIEKFYPFRITKINWSIKGKSVEYEIVGAPQGVQSGTGTYGSVPASIELTGQTVRDILTGAIQYSNDQADETNPGASTTTVASTTGDQNAQDDRELNRAATQAPPKAQAAKTTAPGIRGGLMAAVQKARNDQEKAAKFKLQSRYSLIFAKGAEAIADAKITKSGSAEKSQVAMGTPVSKDTKSAVPDTNSQETTTRNYTVTQGTSIMATINRVICQSDYVTVQAAITYDERTNIAKPNPAAKKDGPINWFYVEQHVKPIGYDEERNDFVYEVIYVVKPYEVVTLYSQYFNPPPFPGVHKSYPYWFTGQNTAVLNYESEFNSMFYVNVTGDTPTTLQQSQQQRSRSMRDMIRLQASAASYASRQGADDRANEIAANAQEYLYSTYSNQTTKLRIIGDPAWMPQGEYSGYLDTVSSKDPFLPDGTINYNRGDTLFEVVWQRPEPYDLNTGLQDPYARQAGRKQGKVGEALQSVVWKAREGVSYFRDGKFEQEITGDYYPFAMPDLKNAALPASPTAAQTPADAAPEETTDENSDTRVTDTAALQLPVPNGALLAPMSSQQPPSGDTGVDAGGNNVGILLRDETGQASTLRINPETGELYNAAGLPAPPRAPSATQQANQDALARYIKEIGAQDPEFVDPTRIPNPPAPDVYGQVMNRET
jgi:hypothetical protein